MHINSHSDDNNPPLDATSQSWNLSLTPQSTPCHSGCVNLPYQPLPPATPRPFPSILGMPFRRSSARRRRYSRLDLLPNLKPCAFPHTSPQTPIEPDDIEFGVKEDLFVLERSDPRFFVPTPNYSLLMFFLNLLCWDRGGGEQNIRVGVSMTMSEVCRGVGVDNGG